MTDLEREAILEEEVLILRNSGEIPEIALHTSLYYLEEDEEGPRLSLKDRELHRLYDAALARAKEIVLRDLDPGNRDLTIYRGLARSIVNWRRLKSFCRRIDKRCPGFESEVSGALKVFIERECDDVACAGRPSSINCSSDTVLSFCAELGIDPGLLPDGWVQLCPE